MKMKKLRVALIFGGAGAEHEISLRGGEYLLRHIDKERYIPIPIVIEKGGAWRSFPDGAALTVRLTEGGARIARSGRGFKIDVAFPLLHGDFGEDGKIAGLLESLGVAYVGCDVLSGAVAADKLLCKAVAESLGIPTVRGLAITSPTSCEVARELAEREIGYPMFIKPSGLGSSVGAAKADSPEKFDAAYLGAARHGDRILIEEYLADRRELECSYFDGCDDPYLPPSEVIPVGVYSYDEKYSDTSRARCIVRARVTEGVRATLRDYSERLVRALGIRQLSRIDFFLSDGIIYFNEINTMPGFTETSLFPLSVEAAGISGKELITRLIDGAYKRGATG